VEELGHIDSPRGTPPPPPEWVRAMYSTGPRDGYHSPVTVQVHASLLEKGEFQVRTNTAGWVRKSSPVEILAVSEFEGQSLRRHNTAGKRRETNKPRSILVKRGDVAAEVKKYLSDWVFVPALERVKQSRERIITCSGGIPLPGRTLNPEPCS
jgi:hypothetical protein